MRGGEARHFGVAVPVFSLRSTKSRGIGDIGDLGELARWAERAGLDLVQILPIQETPPGESSPYSALSAFAIDPVYVCTDWLEGSGPTSAPVDHDGPIDRTAVRHEKLRLLARAFDRIGPEAAPESEETARFRAFCERERSWLDDYACFRLLKELHDWWSWTDWPAGQRTRQADAMAALRGEHGQRIELFRWIQWVAHEQWACVRAAARKRGVMLKGDLPFSVGLDSVDCWARRDLFRFDWEVGAPPDDFSATGQNWGLPLYDWEAHRERGFDWWRERIRHACRLYEVFRIDHVVGLFRTYAFPREDGASPQFHPGEESAQRRHGESFLRMVLDEVAGKAVPMAEDLGTIPPWVRETLHHLGIPGYKVLRWERDDGVYRDPAGYDPVSVATTGTHDTSTLVEWWDDESTIDERRALCSALGLGGRADAKHLGEALRHELLESLFRSGSRWVVVPMQDLLGERERVNVPMSVAESNWAYRIPFVLDRPLPPPVERETEWLRRTLAKVR